MQTPQFTNFCLLLIVGLLFAIAFRPETNPVHAAKKFQYEVVAVSEGTVAEKIKQETLAGWEPIAVPMWGREAGNVALGYVIFRK